jgi:hypothetical protein
MLPRFRMVAVSMERLQVGRARVTVIPIPMVPFDPVVMVEEQPTVTTWAPLLSEQPRQFGPAHWMPSLSDAPVHPIAIVGTASALDFAMPRHCHLAVSPKARYFRVARRGGKGQAGAPPMPRASGDPADRCARMAPACPGAELDPEEMSEPMISGLTPPGAGVSGPAPDCGVELAKQRALRQGSPALNESPKLRQMLLRLGLGGFDQGVGPQTPMASGAFPRLVFAHPVLPEGAPQERQAGLSAFQGRAHAPFGLVEAQPHLCQPHLEHVLTVLKHLTILVQHHAILGVGDDPSVRGALGDGPLHAVQGAQRQERCTAAALWRPGGGRAEVVIFEAPCLKPGVEWSAHARGSLHFGQ